MDICLKNNNISIVKTVFDAEIPVEETSEISIPESEPGIIQVLNTCLSPYIRDKTTDNGKVYVTGLISGTVLYVQEGSGEVKKADVGIPFSVTESCEFVKDDSLIVVTARVTSCDTKQVNSHKLMVKAEILVNVSCYCREDLVVPYDTEDENSPVEILKSRKKVRVTTGVNEKAFIITDEIAIPPSKPDIGEILCSRISLSADEVKNVGNKLIFKGAVNYYILYKADRSGEIGKLEYSTVFSQIMEIDACSDNMNFDVKFALTGAYLTVETVGTGGENGIAAELHILSQSVSSTETEFCYIEDAYCTKHEMNCEQSRITILRPLDARSFSETIDGSIECSNSVKAIIASDAFVGPVKSINNDGRIEITADVNVLVLFRADDDSLMCVSKKISAVAESDETESECRYSAEIKGEIYVIIGSGGIDIRMTVEFRGEALEKNECTVIKSISYDETNCRNLSLNPSVSLYRTRRDDLMWNIAKRYDSSVELIASANDFESDAVPEEGTLLIIPKKR